MMGPCRVAEAAQQDHQQRLGRAVPADQLGIHEARCMAHMWPATPASMPAMAKAASL